MTLESFKDIYGSRSAAEKLDLLIENMETKAWDDLHAAEASDRGNKRNADYYRSESRHMADRILWLRSEIRRELWVTEITEN